MRELWWVSSAAAEALGALGARSVSGWMAACAAGTTLSTDRDAAAVRLEGPRGPLLVKWRAVPAARRWRWWLRPSRERREARGLLAARDCGIDVPGPLAVGERRDALGRLVGAVLVRPFLEGLASAAEQFAADGGAVLLAPVARALRAWHDAGWRHGDCWPKNLLVAPDGARVVPIGAPQARAVPPGPRPDRARRADLARFAAGCRALWPTRDPFAFLDVYAPAGGAPSRAALEARSRPLLERVLAKRAEDERTRPQREPAGPPQPVPLPPDPGRLHRVTRRLP